MYKHVTVKYLAHLLMLAILVISLTAIANAATSPPQVAALDPITQGLRSPAAVAIDADGNIYAADSRAGGVVKLNKYGVLEQTIKTAGIPFGVAIGKDGLLIVSQGSFVARYNADGTEAGRFDRVFGTATGLAVDSDTGYIYVVDSFACEVRAFTSTGAATSIKFGSKGTATGQFQMPTGIAFEKLAKNIAVVDTLNSRVQFFDVNGSFIKSIGSAAVRINDIDPVTKLPIPRYPLINFASPMAVSFQYSSSGVRMYVVDSFQGNLQVIDPSGAGSAVIFTENGSVAPVNYNYIGKYGTSKGELMVPTDAKFDSVNSRLVVVNGAGYINVYGIDGGVSPVNTTPPVVEPPPVVVLQQMALTLATTATVTNNSNFALTGSVFTGAAVTISNASASKTATLDTPSGAVTEGTTLVAWNEAIALTEGSNTIKITAAKPGYAPATLTHTVILDTKAPLLNVSALSNNSYTSTQVQNISGTVTDDLAVALTINGQPISIASGAFSTPVSLLVGANKIEAIAIDAAGNQVSEVRTINFDAAKPLITVTAPMDNAYMNTAAVSISGTVDKATSVFKIAGNTVSVAADNSWSTKLDLVSGLNTIEITATDLYGNTSAVKRSIVFDAVNPEISISSPAQDVAVNIPNITVSGTILDSTSSVTVTAEANGVSLEKVGSADGKFSFNVPFTAEGNYAVKITAVDAAKNSTTTVRNIQYDLTAPALTINDSAAYAPQYVSGIVEPGASVSATDGTFTVQAVIAADSKWTVDLGTADYTPENLFIRATDSAGNVTSKSLVYSYPTGDFDGKNDDGTINYTGKPTLKDALQIIKMVVNNTTPTAEQLKRGDIGPLLKGKPNPNGKLDLTDAILVLRRALGLPSW